MTEFGGLNPWCSNFVSDPYGMAVWRTIRNFWPLVETNLSFKIGIETRIFFGMMELINHHFQICGNTEAGVSAGQHRGGTFPSEECLMIGRLIEWLHSLES